MSTDLGSRYASDPEEQRGDLALLNVAEAARLLGLCPASVYAMPERGELVHVRVGNTIKIVVQER
jgi:excisionase family DNA binding protein